MNFKNKLISGLFIKRYKRFFVDIKMEKKVITAHCPNPGSMQKLLTKGNKVWITKSNNEKRKLSHTLQIIEVNNSKFCVNTHITNKIVKEALENNYIEDLAIYNQITPEKKYGISTRFDFLLNSSKKNKKAFLEVKSVSLSRKKGHAEFPDSVTSRGKKHLESLISANKQGYDCYLLFLVQIENCQSFSIAADIDPEYSKFYKEAVKKNIKILCYDCKFSDKSIEINNKIKIY